MKRRTKYYSVKRPVLMTDFDQTITDIVTERGADYGHPLDDFERAAALKAVLAECNDPVLRHAMEMICVKLARLIHNPTHIDTINDIAGYARTMLMVIEKRKDNDT